MTSFGLMTGLAWLREFGTSFWSTELIPSCTRLRMASLNSVSTAWYNLWHRHSVTVLSSTHVSNPLGSRCLEVQVSERWYKQQFGTLFYSDDIRNSLDHCFRVMTWATVWITDRMWNDLVGASTIYSHLSKTQDYLQTNHLPLTSALHNASEHSILCHDFGWLVNLNQKQYGAGSDTQNTLIKLRELFSTPPNPCSATLTVCALRVRVSPNFKWQ